MDLHQAIYSRRAVRDYTPEPVGREALTRLIDAAIQAPSAVNEQPLSFSIVQDRKLLERVSGEAKAYGLKMPPTGVPQRVLERLRDPNSNIFYNAPALVLISSKSQSPWAVVNCTLAAQNLMLCAYAEGFGTCWIGLAQPWLETAAGKALIGLPAGYLPVAPVIVGRPAAVPPAVERRAPETRWIG